MHEETAATVITSDLLKRIELAATSAAKEILTGRRIIDVEGPYGVGLTTVEVGNDDLCREPGPEEASAVVSRAVSVPMIYRRFAISKRRIVATQDMHWISPSARECFKKVYRLRWTTRLPVGL